MTPGRIQRAHRIVVALYALLSGLWILLSDRVLESISPSTSVLTRIQTLKGWLFVATTATILHFLLKRYESDVSLSGESLRESEGRFRAAFEFAPLGICLTGTDGRFLRVNRTFSVLIGRDPADLLTRDYRSVLHPDDVEASENLMRRALAGEMESYEMERRYLKKGGEVVWALVKTSLLRNPSGRPTHFITHVLDIGERRKAELEIRRLNAELERRIEERTAQLEAANRELESFSYTASHDLRSPLNSIDGFARLLEEEYGDALGPEGKRYVERVLVASRRMAQLIDDLLAFSRVSRSEMVRQLVNLSAVAAEVGDELSAANPDRRVNFVVQPGLIVHADPALLRIVVENLLRNAWKFTSKHPTARIEIGSATAGRETACFVRDDGAGFDPAYSERLFSVFQRLHSLKEFEGTGIGLATVRRIVERHGGRVWAEGEVEKGATFYFTLGAGM